MEEVIEDWVAWSNPCPWKVCFLKILAFFYCFRAIRNTLTSVLCLWYSCLQAKWSLFFPFCFPAFLIWEAPPNLIILVLSSLSYEYWRIFQDILFFASQEDQVVWLIKIGLACQELPLYSFQHLKNMLQRQSVLIFDMLSDTGRQYESFLVNS